MTTNNAPNPTTDLPLPDKMRQREIVRLRQENERLRLIVRTVIPQAGGFDPEDDDEVERIALAWCARFHEMKARVLELEKETNDAN